MRLTSRLAALWRNLAHRERIDRELDAEVRAAFDLLVEDRLRAGDTPAEARRAAALEWGRAEHVTERVRETRGGGMISRIGSDLLGDLRIAMRGLRRRPGFTAVALVTLALGIGANTAIFSVVHAVLLRPLPYEAPDRLVRITGRELATGADGNIAPADAMDFARDSATLSGVAVNGYIGEATVSGGLEAERVGRVQVTAGFFATLGIQPALGRLFSPDEDRPGGDHVALITDGYWRRRFAGDPGIVGRSLNVDAVPTTIVGVLPSSYRHVEEISARDVDMFTLYRFDRAAPNRGGRFVRGIGRLQPGRTVDEARAELVAIAARLEREFPDTNTNRGVVVRPLQEAMVGSSRPLLLLLFSAVGVVLLVVCANMANLLLAAGSSRQRELAVRAAIGAGRARLARQFLAESLLLGLLGSAGGILIATAAWPALAALSAAGVPRVQDVGLDWTVLCFAVGVAVLASITFGLIPALALSGGDLHEGVKQGGRHSGPSLHRRAREALILGEVAMSVVLLVAAGLLAESLWRLQAVSPGFAPESAISMGVALPGARYQMAPRIAFYQRLEEQVRSLPGVVQVGAVNIPPLSGNYDSRGIRIDDHPEAPVQGLSPQARSVTPGYFEAMGVPLIRGRWFDARDQLDSPLVVIVSDTMARRYWPGEDTVGRRLTFNAGIPADQRQDVGGAGSREVVGVVGDVKHLSLAEDPVSMFYTPHAQQPSSLAMTLVVRASGDAAGLIGAIRAELAGLDQEVPLSDVRTLEQVVSGVVAEPAVRARLVGLFAVLALVLAAVGVYGVVGFLVGQRTHEIGVRMALGASASAVLTMLVRDGMRPVAGGVLVGLAAAFGLSRLLQAMLFGVTPTDPLAYGLACGALALVGLLATLVPARRALSVDPVSALRDD